MKSKKVLKLLAIVFLIVLILLFIINSNNYSEFVVSDNTEDIKDTKEMEEVILIDTEDTNNVNNINNKLSLTSGMYSLTNNQMNHSKDDIKNKYNNAKTSLNDDNMFETMPVLDDFNQVPGKLSEIAINDTLNTINYYRYLAGTDNVSVVDRALSYNMKGAILLSQSNFSHTPNKPNNMTEKFYLDASCGTSFTISNEYKEVFRKSGI